MRSLKEKISTYVCIHVISEASERFINMCRYKVVNLWDIAKTEQGFTAKLSKDDFMELKDICHKTRSKIAVTKRVGIPFLLFKYRKHYSFIVGILISCVMIYVCSLFVWNISFTGNAQYTNSTLLKYLASKDIHAGIFVSSIECDAIEQAMRNDFDNITWVSAQISGTRLIIHIKESEDAVVSREISEENRDIIASCDGVVQSIITRKGTPLVKPGDTVTKGQILVSGVVDILNDGGEVIGKVHTKSDADILISSSIEYSDSLDVVHQEKIYTGNKTTKKILGVVNSDIELSLPFKIFENADVVTEVNDLALTESFYLPFYYGDKIYYEYNVMEQQYTKEEAAEILDNNLSYYIKDLLENEVQIIDYDVKMYNNSSSYTAKGVINVLMPGFEYAAIADENAEENIGENAEQNSAATE